MGEALVETIVKTPNEVCRVSASCCFLYSVQLQVQTFYGPWTLSGTTRVSQYQKGKTNLNLLEQEIVSGSGIICVICKSASWFLTQTQPPQRPTTQFFTGQMPFLPPNQL